MNNENMSDKELGEFLVKEINNWINNLTNDNKPEVERCLKLIGGELYNQGYSDIIFDKLFLKVQTLKHEIKLLKEILLKKEKLEMCINCNHMQHVAPKLANGLIFCTHYNDTRHYKHNCIFWSQGELNET